MGNKNSRFTPFITYKVLKRRVSVVIQERSFTPFITYKVLKRTSEDSASISRFTPFITYKVLKLAGMFISIQSRLYTFHNLQGSQTLVP